jgi:hypothetical protein
MQRGCTGLALCHQFWGVYTRVDELQGGYEDQIVHGVAAHILEKYCVYDVQGVHCIFVIDVHSIFCCCGYRNVVICLPLYVKELSLIRGF